MEQLPPREPDDYRVEPFVFDGEIVDDDTMEQLFADLAEEVREEEERNQRAASAAVATWRQSVLDNPAAEQLQQIALYAPDEVIQEYLRQIGVLE